MDPKVDMSTDRDRPSAPGAPRRRAVPAVVGLVVAVVLIGGLVVLTTRGDGPDGGERVAEVESEQVRRTSSTTSTTTVPTTTASATVAPTAAPPAPTSAPPATSPPAPQVDIGTAAGGPVDDGPVAVERAPADRAAAEAAIAATVAGLVDPALAPDRRRDLLTGDEPARLDALAGRLQAVASSPCAADARAVLDRVYFFAPTWATVTFRMEGTTVPEAGRTFLFGTTVVQGADGRWRSAASETTDLVDLVGPFCGA